MTADVHASVMTRVNPEVAFAIFTDEINRWWRPGPDFSVDAHRAVGWRIERGVGGSWLEFYDDLGDNAVAIGEITTWEPGSASSSGPIASRSRSMPPSPCGSCQRAPVPVSKSRTTGWTRSASRAIRMPSHRRPTAGTPSCPGSGSGRTGDRRCALPHARPDAGTCYSGETVSSRAIHRLRRHVAPRPGA